MMSTPKLLDVGCGNAQTAIDAGWPDQYDYHGIDVDPQQVERAREHGLTIDHANADHGLDYDDNTFDRVVCKAVLEHVETPLFVAEECRRVTNPGGTFTVIVPSDRSYDIWGDYTHKRAFRRDALHDLLTDAGWHVTSIQPRMGWDSPGAAAKSLARMLVPWTPYGYPRAWHATATNPRGGTA